MIAANDNRQINFISMFSGIEAASVAFKPLGWKALCFAEIEKFPAAVLAHHYPDVPNVGDMSKHDWSQYAGKVDIVCGGPPCQDFSVAGLRAGLDGDRGNLSLVYMRALHAIKPRNAIVENVPGWLSDKKNAFGCFLAGLVGADDPLRTPDGKSWPNAGMVAGPLGRAAWRVLDAQYFNLAQRRRRVLVVADFGNGADPAAVLFEPEGVLRHPPSRGEAGKGITHDVAPSIVSSGRGVERTGDTRGQDPVVAVFDSPVASVGNRTSGPLDVATAVNAHGGPHGRLDFESETFIAHAIQAGALRTNPDSGPDGVGVQEGIAYTLEARAEVQAVCVTGNVTHSLMPAITTASAVRRLTPRECERLQGFDDDYTLIPVRKVSKANQAKARADTSGAFREVDGVMWALSPDGPRYKALGNSWAVPKFTWLGQRIAALMPKEKPAAANNNDNDGVRDEKAAA
ncbi:DNA cytosine methyltransferase [Rhizobium laguerreae]|uniref:DNA cytosine methyltransferase n=1 Tax=Rhizobium laguerreae TaxID=1076926 RepID=UPI0014788265|nr:DNA cytosine methyltransferase [Rhizobium laguerreae]NNH56931.1 DNA cytosine methyltransferase [Rhizobium laguerreae]